MGIEEVSSDGKVKVEHMPPMSLPCENLLVFVKYFIDTYHNKNIEQLDYLIDTEYSPYKSLYSQYETEYMYWFIFNSFKRQKYVREYLKKGSQEEKLFNNWMDFDKDELNRLLYDSFFDEFCEVYFYYENLILDRENIIKKIMENDYENIEFYIYYKTLSVAAELLDEDRTMMLWRFLCHDDMILTVIQLRYFSILSRIYRKFGWSWFSTDLFICRENTIDSILYKWAYYAICAEKNMADSNHIQLKKDFNDLFVEFCMKCAQSDSGQTEEDLIKFFIEEMNHFDEDDLKQSKEADDKKNQMISKLQAKTVEQSHTILSLKKDIESLKRSYASTLKNIGLIQNEKDTDTNEKINRILNHLFACLPEQLKGELVKKKFGEVWDDLSIHSREDITRSIELFEMMQDSEFSTLALLRSVERELELNIFKPFRESDAFKNIERLECTLKKVESTHKSLQRPVTLGSIPFIGRDVNNERYIQESSVLQAFAQFLGDKKEVFTEICRSIDQYKIDNGMKSIVDLRNGIAHGDATITEFCDESCYHDVCKFIYEPPIQIMFSIILHSLKGT